MTTANNIPALPERITGLATLASNLWWSWNREARSLFRAISPALWRRTRHNPLELLQDVSSDRLDELAGDEEFLERYKRVMDAFSAVVEGRDTWFASTHPDSSSNVVAYFCAEFALHRSIPIYSGGLGVLAGDHCKAAADLGIPLVGVGLFYAKGYFDQRLRLDGWQEDSEERFHRTLAPVVRITVDGSHVLTTLRLSGRDVRVGAWEVQVGSVRVILLDTNLEDNDPADRDLAARLYGGGEELRLRQEWILGVGGVRVLRKLGYEPSAWHANEGHAAFMLMERIREKLALGLELDQAVEDVRSASVFTTHTPVPAGHDHFSRDMIERVAGPVWEELGLDDRQFFDLGRHPADAADDFHMTPMAMRLSTRLNGVSVRHATVSRAMWRKLWPDAGEDDVPIRAVTNGVHLPTWMSARFGDLLDQANGPDWRTRAHDEGLWDSVLQLEDRDVWQVHGELKAALINHVHELARYRWSHRWTDATHLVGAGTLLTAPPLTIGFARRFATYKRADLIFRDVERLKAMLLDAQRPVQIVFAGKAHPADDPGKEVLQRVYGFAQDPAFEGRVAFLEDYGMHMARHLVQGVDVWLNVPRVPLEACGTSGMKAALNGVPQLGTADGWWEEGHTGENGWSIPVTADENPDQHDAEHLYRLLEDQVIPAYYDRDVNGVPAAWARCMKHSIREAGRRFTAGRMLMDYANDYYVPAMRDGQVPVVTQGS
jgi:starch phosphorylase